MQFNVLYSLRNTKVSKNQHHPHHQKMKKIILQMYVFVVFIGFLLMHYISFGQVPPPKQVPI